MRSWETWAVGVVILGLIVGLLRDLFPPTAGVLGALVTTLLLGVVEPAEAFAGFANPATIAIAGLFVVARAVELTGLIGVTLARVLGDGLGERRALARLIAPTIAASSIMANTPIVATLATPLRSWAERTGRSPSRFLMPLSFAAILGGVITTVGTSTTLLVSGLLDDAGAGPLTLLEVAPVGVPIAVVGGGLMVLLAPRLLPDREDPVLRVSRDEREYTVSMWIEPGSELDGIDVATARLRNLEGVFLASVERDGRTIAPVQPSTTLLGDDILTFVGSVTRVCDLSGQAGLKHVEVGQVALLSSRTTCYHEAVVGPRSPLSGKTLKDVSFRGRYGAAVVAVHRSGEPVRGKLGEAVLQPGDALLLVSDPGFPERWRGRDFLIVVPVDPPAAVMDRRAHLALWTLLAMVGVTILGWLSLVEAVLAAVAILVGTRTIGVNEAKDAIDLDVLLIIGGSIGLAGAVTASGLADIIATVVTRVAAASGPVVALGSLMVATLILTELVTNAAAAALMVPVALAAAPALDVPSHALAIGVAVAASASFLTPIGYQTNTIVYGLGGYRYGDYWRLGLPLTSVVLLTSMVVVPLVWDFGP